MLQIKEVKRENHVMLLLVYYIMWCLHMYPPHPPPPVDPPFAAVSVLGQLSLWTFCPFSITEPLVVKLSVGPTSGLGLVHFRTLLTPVLLVQYLGSLSCWKADLCLSLGSLEDFFLHFVSFLFNSEQFPCQGNSSSCCVLLRPSFLNNTFSV